LSACCMKLIIKKQWQVSKRKKVYGKKMWTADRKKGWWEAGRGEHEKRVWHAFDEPAVRPQLLYGPTFLTSVLLFFKQPLTVVTPHHTFYHENKQPLRWHLKTCDNLRHLANMKSIPTIKIQNIFYLKIY